jgi:hypothetical protein
MERAHHDDAWPLPWAGDQEPAVGFALDDGIPRGTQGGTDHVVQSATPINDGGMGQYGRGISIR